MEKEKFIKELDELVNKPVYNKLKQLFDYSQELNIPYLDITIRVDTVDGVQEFFKSYNLTDDIQLYFIFNNRPPGQVNVQWYYKGFRIQIENFNLKENLIDILTECIKQDTHKPKIKSKPL